MYVSGKETGASFLFFCAVLWLLCWSLSLAVTVNTGKKITIVLQFQNRSLDQIQIGVERGEKKLTKET